MSENDLNKQAWAPAAAEELTGLDLGDKRLENRAVRVVTAKANAPEKSLPQATADNAELIGAYRFCSNKRVNCSALMAPHITHTLERIEAAGEVVIIHDTSEFEFGGRSKREGLGYLRGQKQGFFAHVSLAVDSDSHRPLGTAALFPWTRSTRKSKRTASGRKKSGADYAKETDKESARWFQQVDAVEQLVGDRARLIHVMDREADAYELLSNMKKNGYRFVVRLSTDRTARDPETLLAAHVLSLAEQAPDVLLIEVPIGRREKSTVPGIAKTFPAREARGAKLAFRATTVEIRRPNYLDKQKHQDWIQVNVVQVHELETPEGLEPVEWTLITTEPIDTPEQIRRVVELYRCRWTIEEFFKALKTGCEVEQAQLESYAALLNLLALSLPVAWQLLLLRNLARTQPDAPATEVLTPTQIEVLRFKSRYPIPPRPTIATVALAVAMMGGYIRSKRPFGWLTLGRGLEKLITLTAGWIAAKEQAPGR
jgi:hypothetical protein